MLLSVMSVEDIQKCTDEVASAISRSYVTLTSAQLPVLQFPIQLF